MSRHRWADRRRAGAPLGVERRPERRVREVDQLSVVEEPDRRRNLQHLCGAWLEHQNEIVAAVDAGPIKRKLSAEPVFTEAHDASAHVGIAASTIPVRLTTSIGV